MVFAYNFYLNLVKKQKHLLYFSNGLEYNTQKIPYQNYFQYNFALNNEKIDQYNNHKALDLWLYTI